MPSFYPGQKANELAKEAQKRFDRAVEDLKREEAATNRLAEEYGQLQLNVIRSTIKRFVTFLENTGRKASESEKRLLEGMDFSVQQMKEYKAAAVGAEQYFMAGVKSAGAAAAGYGGALCGGWRRRAPRTPKPLSTPRGAGASNGT